LIAVTTASSEAGKRHARAAKAYVVAPPVQQENPSSCDTMVDRSPRCLRNAEVSDCGGAFSATPATGKPAGVLSFQKQHHLGKDLTAVWRESNGGPGENTRVMKI
jgi:hypothetical protein